MSSEKRLMRQAGHGIGQTDYRHISSRRPELVIRKEQPEDIYAIHHLNTAAFGREAEADLVDKLRTANALTLSLVATEKCHIVGHIAFSPVIIESEDQVLTAIGLGPMAVSPERQGCGIGSQLVEAGLNEIRKRGHTIVVVLGNPEFYSRFGFLPAGQFGIKWKINVPDEVFMVKELSEHALRGVKGIVKYRPEFNAM
jgi:putative acetyltransferase